MMAKLTADDLELRLAKNTEIDSFMLWGPHCFVNNSKTTACIDMK